MTFCGAGTLVWSGEHWINYIRGAGGVFGQRDGQPLRHPIQRGG